MKSLYLSLLLIVFISQSFGSNLCPTSQLKQKLNAPYFKGRLELSRVVKISSNFVIPKKIVSGRRCTGNILEGPLANQAKCKICLRDNNYRSYRRIPLTSDMELGAITFDENSSRCGQNSRNQFRKKDLLPKSVVMKRLQEIRKTKPSPLYFQPSGESYNRSIAMMRVEVFSNFETCLSRSRATVFHCLEPLRICSDRGFCAPPYEFNKDDVYRGKMREETFGYMTREIFKLSCRDHNYSKYKYAIKSRMPLELSCISKTRVRSSGDYSQFALFFKDEAVSMELTRSQCSRDSGKGLRSDGVESSI